MQTRKPWTIMVYIAADNNLANFGVDSLKQMKSFGGESVNILAEFDPGPLQQTKRYVFDGLTSTFSSIRNNQVGVGPAVSPGDADNVGDFIDWAYAKFPAEHYYLIIWGHGGGVTNDFPRDQTFVSRHSLLSLRKGTNNGTGKGTNNGTGKGFFAPATIFTDAATSQAFVDRPTNYFRNVALRNVLEHARKALKKKVDIIGMDVCDMNMVEVAYELRGVADFLVASQDSIPDASWPYDRLLNELLANPNIQPRNLAGLVPAVYKIAYSDYFNQPVTLSALDLQSLAKSRGPINGNGGAETVTCAFKNLTAKLMKLITNEKTSTDALDAIKNARKEVRTFSAGLFVDLIHFCQVLQGQPFEDPELESLLINVVNGVRRMVVANESSLSDQTSNGTSIFFPTGDFAARYQKERFSRFYNNLDFPKETGWGRFLDKFLAQSSRKKKRQATAKAVAKPVQKAVAKPVQKAAPKAMQQVAGG